MVVNCQRRVPVDVGPLQVFVNQARHELGLGEDELTVCLVSDAAIARMNRRFRGKRGPTDVLSFPANGAGPRQGGKVTERTEATEGTGAAYLGDIAISPETGAAQCAPLLSAAAAGAAHPDPARHVAFAWL